MLLCTSSLSLLVIYMKFSQWLTCEYMTGLFDRNHFPIYYLYKTTGYGLEGPGSIPGRQDLFLLHIVRTGSEAHPASYPVGTGGDFPGGRVAGA
jgi:hypothetical protein